MDNSNAFDAYLKNLAHCDVMPAEVERQQAANIAMLRERRWQVVLAQPHFVESVLVLCDEMLSEPVPAALADSARAAAMDLICARNKRTLDALKAAGWLLSEHLSARDDRDLSGLGSRYLGVRHGHCGRLHDDVCSLDLGGVVSDVDGPAQLAQPPNRLAFLHVGAGDCIALSEQHLGDAAHARPADADEVDALDFSSEHQAAPAIRLGSSSASGQPAEKGALCDSAEMLSKMPMTHR